MKKIVVTCIAFLLLAAVVSGQQRRGIDAPAKIYQFSSDSLQGFDEDAARRGAIAEHFSGVELAVKMAVMKRQFINAKYNIQPAAPHAYEPLAMEVQPACVNEDFEASNAGTITVSNQIQGWTITRGENNPFNNPGVNSCNLNGCCPTQPSESALFDAPNGLIDDVIGSCYPIYSVFGDGPANPNAASANTHIPQPMRGTKFIRINSKQVGDYSIERLSKTFNVTASNALFQFAFIAVFHPDHNCCEAGAFKIRLLNASAGNTVLTCPSFSASAPSQLCTNTVSGISFLQTEGGDDCQPMDPNDYTPVFNKWQLSSMDLTSYIGQNITIEIVATDCIYSGHYGYVYFDAQCGPMSILGNGVSFPAGSQNVTIPTCGPNGATICATPGLGPYSWAGPNIPPGYSTNSYSNQCFTTNISAQYTVYLNPPGGCAPFTRIVNTSITPAPALLGSVVQAKCGDTLATISVTPSGSAGNPKYIQWFPAPYTLNQQTTTATYIIPPVNSPTTVVSITAADQVGCPITITLGVNPPAPVPTFSLLNNTGTYTLSCLDPTLNISALTNYTYGASAFFWSSNSFTSSAQTVSLTQAGSYSVTLSDPVSQCFSQKVFNVGANLQAPASALSPTFQNITCTTTPQTLTLTATSPTVNVRQEIVSPLGGTLTAFGPYTLYVPGTVGTFTHITINEINGCRTTKTFVVNSSQAFPAFDLQSPQNYTLGCNATSVAVINIVNAQAVPGQGGAVSYSLMLPNGQSASTNTTQASYNVNSPGSYTVITRNIANGCETKVPISILTNTVKPSIDSVLVPTNVLTCFTPSMTLRGVSFTKNVEYSWKMPQGQNLSGDELPVNADLSKPTQTALATYTLNVMDKSSTCNNTQTVVIAQNLFPPIVRATADRTLTCLNRSVTITNGSTPNQNNPFPKSLPAIAELWQGPSPQLDLENNTTYVGFMPGTYTLTALDLNNGCRAIGTFTVAEDREYPLLTPINTVLPCGAESQNIMAEVVVSPQNYNKLKYEWESPTVTSDKSKAILTIRQTGVYNLAVTNTVNGCGAETAVEVKPDSLIAEIKASKIEGFAPLTIDFENLSTTNTGTDNINSVWMFGNNATTSLASVSSTNTTYTQPGTYTVILHVSKGSCLAIDKQIVVVDIPSQMVIPNVFTPNGDGVNDLYFLQRSGNLTEINATIYDRWGNIVYDVKSTSGQIEWDGNTMSGKTAPTGTYYYIITAKGRDGKEYDEKGTISLLR